MSFTVADVFKRASIVLNDDDTIRWPLTEQLLWLNDGMSAIALFKPNATSITMTIPLIEGTQQTLADDQVSIVRAICNHDGTTPGVRGRAITPITRDAMDRLIPNWHDPTVLPFQDEADHIIQDMMDPKTFYVVPGNTGDGYLEATLAIEPAAIDEPPTDPELMTSYEALTVPMRDIYRTVLTDYVLFRAFSKDIDVPSAAARAVAHKRAFDEAIGRKSSAEAVANIKTTKATS